jgi:D-3-phosphoglycerate dehydrogenase
VYTKIDKRPVVFLADDYVLKDNFDEIAEELERKGIQVVRGPKTSPGTKLVYRKEDYLSLFGNADVLMFSSRSICDQSVIKACSKARAIINPSIGMETVDIQSATEQGIIVGNGAILENVISVAEAAVCAVLMLAQQTLKSIRYSREKGGKPPIKQSWSTMLCGKTVGFIGFGRIARATAERLASFGVKMVAYSPSLTEKNVPAYVKSCTLEEVLVQSDYLGIYVVINEGTKNIINERTLRMMKSSAYLINIARGEAVDESALYNALKNGDLAGAALDTFQVEPLPMDSPLRTLENVILTPHMAGSTIDNYLGITKTAVENISRVLHGELPLYCKNLEISDI